MDFKTEEQFRSLSNLLRELKRISDLDMISVAGLEGKS